MEWRKRSSRTLLFRSFRKVLHKTYRTGIIDGVGRLSMKAERFIEYVKSIGIEMYAGIPDSTLQVLCDYLNKEETVKYYTLADEGAAVAFAIGEYLASGRPGCVYMQNSGIGNIVNPVTSLAHPDVYGIPMLLVIGWRGEPGKKDEPQHKFMGRITKSLLDDLEIESSVLDSHTTESDLIKILKTAEAYMSDNRQYALLIKKGFLEDKELRHYANMHLMSREEAVRIILEETGKESYFVTTTGKISREAYEQSERIFGGHRRIFMAVGGMGYASMIAAGLAMRQKEKRIYCLDGDGALLMHMGNLVCIGQMHLKNLVYICLNNEAHESVGGMPTGAGAFSYVGSAMKAGFEYVAKASSPDELKNELLRIGDSQQSVFLEVQTAISSRGDLGRPKEHPEDNKKEFMETMGPISD